MSQLNWLLPFKKHVAGTNEKQTKGKRMNDRKSNEMQNNKTKRKRRRRKTTRHSFIRLISSINFPHKIVECTITRNCYAIYFHIYSIEWHFSAVHYQIANGLFGWKSLVLLNRFGDDCNSVFIKNSGRRSGIAVFVAWFQPFDSVFGNCSTHSRHDCQRLRVNRM